MYLYDLDIIKARLTAEKTISESKILSEIIKNDVNSQIKKNMNDGQKYYCSSNSAIYERNFEYFKNGKKIIDEWRSNNKLPHGFLKTLIDQKTNYSFSKPISLQGADNIKNAININDFVKDIVKESSKKAIGWLHIFINKDNMLETKVIDSEEIIPIYDTRYQDELLEIIRYYTIQVVNNVGTISNRYKVERWDSQSVTYYEEDHEGNFVLDSMIEINPNWHWSIKDYAFDTVVAIQSNSWGKVPFIPLYNNNELLTDLVPVKPFIDCYDVNISDLSNNVTDIQDSVMALTNYGGMSNKLDEFLEYLKKYKVILLDDQGKLEYLKNDIPVEARKVLKDMLRDSIFEFGQGVDVAKVGDGNITNVVITNRYSALDLKANDIESNVTKFLKKVFWFVNKYLQLNRMTQDNINLIEITYNRSLVINNLEIIDMCQRSKGIISDDTIMSNHPWVSNIEEEKLRMEEEKAKQTEMYFNTDQQNNIINNEDVNNVDNNGSDAIE